MNEFLIYNHIVTLIHDLDNISLTTNDSAAENDSLSKYISFDLQDEKAVLFILNSVVTEDKS